MTNYKKKHRKGQKKTTKFQTKKIIIYSYNHSIAC